MNLHFSKDLGNYEIVCDEKDLRVYLEKFKKQSSQRDSAWVTDYQIKLLSSLVAFRLPNTHFELFPYKREIEVYVKYPDYPGRGGSCNIIRYEEGEDLKRIKRRIAEVVISFWSEFLKFPLQYAREAEKACGRYTSKKIKK